MQLFGNKKVLLTGHTGFKGSWLSAWLHLLGAELYGISLENPPSQPSHFGAAGFSKFVKEYFIDIRNAKELSECVNEIKPDFVFHLAAQALVKKSYDYPMETYHINALGTLNLLESLRLVKNKCAVILITSDKCYSNLEWVWGYRENDAIGGPDPYSASKGAAELVIRSHVKSFFPLNGNVHIAVARAGNVIGGGDWAKDRIVPDCVRSWNNNETLQIRNPKFTRPWQHVLEPLSGYLTLAKRLHDHRKLHGEPFNFGPPAHQNHSVQELVQAMSEYWNKVRWEKISENVEDPYESGLLKLNCDKALHHLHWQAVLSFQDTVRMTAEWYKSYYENSSLIRDVTFSQIEEYKAIAQEKGLRWAL